VTDLRERCRIATDADNAIAAWRCCACGEVVKLAPRCRCGHACCTVPRDAAVVRFAERVEGLAGAFEVGAAIGGALAAFLRQPPRATERRRRVELPQRKPRAPLKRNPPRA